VGFLPFEKEQVSDAADTQATMLYTKVDAQCDKLVTNDRRQLAILNV